MLEKLPHALGEALQGLRHGLDAIVYNHEGVAGAPESLTLTSPAFADGAAMPTRFTEDGEKLSPPLAWSGVPQGALALALVVEDPDAPAPSPLVHALVWALPPQDGALAEGALKSAGSAGEAHALGRNSFLGAQYLPPDPPPGHGAHRYCFQLFALDEAPELSGAPVRSQLVHAMRGHVIARGLLVGTYARP